MFDIKGKVSTDSDTAKGCRRPRIPTPRKSVAGSAPYQANIKFYFWVCLKEFLVQVLIYLKSNYFPVSSKGCGTFQACQFVKQCVEHLHMDRVFMTKWACTESVLVLFCETSKIIKKNLTL
jgi:hypothetical protein